MKVKKSKLALLVMTLGAMTLAGCGEDPNIKPNGGGGGGGGGTSTQTCPPHEWGDYVVVTEPTEVLAGVKTRYCKKCQKKAKDEEIPKLGFPYEVVIKDAEGAEISKKTYRSTEKIEKPADPTAPAGMTFYGWKNIKNGGQIWDFDNDVLGLVSEDVELVPCFVPSNATSHIIEAELDPAIQTMHGCTYSGGADGKQLINDDDKTYGSTCEVNAFNYYKNPFTQKYVIGDVPAGVNATAQTRDMKGEGRGAFVHYDYNNGNTLTYNITVSEAVENVVLFARFSSEYGFANSQTGDTYNRFTDEQFTVAVNGAALSYGTVTMHNVPAIGDFLPFQDYLLGASISLNAGPNVITMKVTNTEGYSGTLPSVAPCIDSIKLLTSATITWDEADLTNLVK